MTGPADTALEAFLGLVAEKGYGGVTLRDVGAAAGLGVADLYRLYRDKPALVAAFLARVDEAVLAGTATALDPEETARDRLFDVMMRPSGGCREPTLSSSRTIRPTCRRPCRLSTAA